MCQEALRGHKIYGLSVQEDFSGQPGWLLASGMPKLSFTWLHMFTELPFCTHLVPGSVGEEGAVQAVSLLARGLEICWGGEIYFRI